MFRSKGAILKSSLSENLKCILGIYERDGAPVLLAKPVVRRKLARTGSVKSQELYKTWLSPHEVAGLINMLQRALDLMDDYEEGVLDLEQLLAEDEDGRRLVNTKTLQNPTIGGAFSLSGEED